MNQSQLERKSPQSSRHMPNNQANSPLKAVIVGGAEGADDLLRILDKDRLSILNINVLGYADKNPDSPGLLYAKEHGIFATTDFNDLFSLEGINLIIESTGSPEILEQIFAKKPAHVSVLDHRVSRLFWKVLQIEKNSLAREY